MVGSLALIILASPTHAQEEYEYTQEDVLVARSNATPIVAWLIDTEVGGVGYDPYAIGAAGEKGCLQLHPFGLLNEYRRFTNGADDFDCAEQVRYTEWKVAEGGGCNWTAYLQKYCLEGV